MQRQANRSFLSHSLRLVVLSIKSTYNYKYAKHFKSICILSRIADGEHLKVNPKNYEIGTIFRHKYNIKSLSVCNVDVRCVNALRLLCVCFVILFYSFFFTHLIVCSFSRLWPLQLYVRIGQAEIKLNQKKKYKTSFVSKMETIRRHLREIRW